MFNFGDYNTARSGYVNPEQPDELLERGWPGYPKNSKAHELLQRFAGF
jgi:hypothetical protein